MKCPYCNKEMALGLLQSSQEIAWLPGEKRKFFAKAELHDGAVVLSELSMLRGSAVRAYICKDCRKVIIDYADDNSDLNN